MGDFNDIGSSNDQWGSVEINYGNINRFVEAYNDCGLLDLANAGPQFSWVRQMGGATWLRRKLDRVLGISKPRWPFRISEGKAFILPHTYSNHHPIRFLSKVGEAPARDCRPFRFEVAWLMREDYRLIWEKAWTNHKGDIHRAIDEVIRHNKTWNNECFGNIFRKKKRLEARIRGIQSSQSYNTSKGLHRLEGRLMKELNDTLTLEELLWFQKSRKAWVEDGDQNTRFYHRATMIRRNRRRVNLLKIDGEWVSNSSIL